VDEPYEWPLKVNRVLTGSFAEFRADHFHAGLDLSTGGRTGLPIAAPADGYVWRIRVSPFGYGRSIYLKLHDGRFVVYAHLQGFCEPATDRVKAMQRKMESYEVDIYLRPKDIPIKRGQIVGFSGRSASKAPHLHFEMRDAASRPINPLALGFAVKDRTPPTLRSVAVVPLDDSSRVNGSPLPVTRQLTLSDTKDRYRAGDPFRVSGRFGVAVEVEDRAENDNYRLGVLGARAEIDGKPLFEPRFDRYSYDRTRLLNLAYDYFLLLNTGKRFLRLFRVPGNSLESYASARSGIIDADKLPSSAGDTHAIVVTAYDPAGNQTVCEIGVTVAPEQISPVPQDILPFQPLSDHDTVFESRSDFLRVAAKTYRNLCVIRVTSDRDTAQHPRIALSVDGTDAGVLPVVAIGDNHWEGVRVLDSTAPVELRIAAEATAQDGRQDLATLDMHLWPITPKDGGTAWSHDGRASFSMPADTVYNPVYVHVSHTAPRPRARLIPHSEAYTFGPIDEPLNRDGTVSLRYAEGANTDRVGLYWFKDGAGWKWYGNALDESTMTVSAESNEMGTFAVFEDDIAPRIRLVSPHPGTAAQPRGLVISAKITDEGAGIDYRSIKMYVDGTFVISEYDPPRKSLLYPVETVLPSGQHKLRIVAADFAGNSTDKTWSFTVR